MKYGIKIPLDIFGEMTEASRLLCNGFGGKNEYLEYISKEFEVAEIATVNRKTDPEALKNAVNECVKRGIEVTIHGSIKDISLPEELFEPYLKLFEADLQPLYNITVHPYESSVKTEEALRGICGLADKMSYPVRITLENQRYANERLLHTLCRDVAQIVRKINSPILYTCFDFGHQLSNEKKQGTDFDTVEDDFISLVRHTHIHGFYEGTTHFPLSCGKCMLEKNITRLIEEGYDETLLLELDPARYLGKFDPSEAVRDSASVLKTAYTQIKAKMSAYDDIRDNYESYIESAANKLKSNSCGMSLLAPAMYIIKMGDTKIAVDPCLWEMPIDTTVRKRLTDLVGECDIVIVTHNHRDHFDKELLNSLPENIKIFMPDFMPFEREGIVYTNDGFTETIGETEISFFESAHSSGDNGVREYGFNIRYREKSYTFPTDIRRYGASHKVFSDTEVLVLHLWLGAYNALNVTKNTYVDELCAFAEGFNAKRIYLSHLFDFRRDITNMWSKPHCDLVNQRLRDAKIIKCGDWIEL